MQFKRFFSWSQRPKEAGEAYIALLAAARNPFFFRELAVPDTLDGRFELIMLALALLHHRLAAIDGSEPFRAALSEAFFEDMERALRELGVLYPDKRLKKMATAYAGRIQAYHTALGDTEALKAALARNLYGTVADGDVALLTRTATVVQRLRDALNTAPDATILNGHYVWPEPLAG